MKLKLFRIIQFVLAILTMLFIFTFNSIEEEVVGIPLRFIWIPFVVYGIFIGGLVVEYVLKQKPIIRTIILSIAVFSSLVCLTDSLDLGAACLILFCIPYAIALFIVSIKGVTIPTTQVKIKTNKVLPEGICDKTELKVMYIYWSVFIIFVIVMTILFEHYHINKAFELFIIPPAIIILILVVNKFNVLKKILQAIHHDLDFETFNHLIDSTLQKNIHPETYNYLLIIKSNYMAVYDLEEAIKIFETIHIPTNKNYKRLYDIVLIEHQIRTKKYEEAQMNINKLNASQKTEMQNFYKVFATTEEMKNIESIYLENNKLKFMNASSIYTKMYYYNTRGNHKEAVKYARKLIEYAPKFKEMVTEANEIMQL